MEMMFCFFFMTQELQVFVPLLALRQLVKEQPHFKSPVSVSHRGSFGFPTPVPHSVGASTHPLLEVGGSPIGTRISKWGSPRPWLTSQRTENRKASHHFPD